MIDLVKISTYRDGGTTVWIESSVKSQLKSIEDAKTCQKYYLDNRIDSSTKGELFDKYPNEAGAVILDKTKFTFINISSIDDLRHKNQTLLDKMNKIPKIHWEILSYANTHTKEEVLQKYPEHEKFIDSITFNS